MSSSTNLVLAIEAAVRGGSVALLENNCEIAVWHGTADVSRAEDLLSSISDMFERTQIDKRNLARIAVSNGPGSYTGIRIGLATALGLARALNIECVGVPLMPAIAELHCTDVNTIVVIPIGRSEFCWQAFDTSNDNVSSNQPTTGSVSELIEYFRGQPQYEICSQHDAFEVMTREPAYEEVSDRVCNIGRDLALAIGSAAIGKRSDLTPNYVRNSQFKSNPL
jgi:tRNA threonylcarbamoyl adenosine modification protein YeaZ